MIGPADALVDVVGPALVVDEVVDGARERHVAKDADVEGAHAEGGAAEQVVEFRVDVGHGGSPVAQSVMVTMPLAKLVAY